MTLFPLLSLIACLRVVGVVVDVDVDVAFDFAAAAAIEATTVDNGVGNSVEFWFLRDVGALFSTTAAAADAAVAKAAVVVGVVEGVDVLVAFMFAIAVLAAFATYRFPLTFALIPFILTIVVAGLLLSNDIYAIYMVM